MTARELFQSSDHAHRFSEIVVEPAFEHAIHAALMTQLENSNRGAQPADSWDAHSKLLGAKEFAETLRKLTQKLDPITRPPWPNLNPNPTKK